MVIRMASRLRVSLADVTGRHCRQLGSFVVEVAELPDEFIRWLRRMADVAEAQLPLPHRPAPPADQLGRDRGHDGQLVPSRPAREKGGRRGNSKA